MESEQFLSKEEFIKLYRAVKDDRERCLLQLMAGTGLRVGEMVQIRIEDIDFDNAYLHIRAENAKYKKARTVVLLPPVIDVLQRLVAGRSSGWLFPGYKKGHLSKPHVERMLQDIAGRSGLQRVVHPDRKGPGRYRIHPHMLRHSFAIFSIEAGIPLSDLQAQLGHASLATTGVYLKASPNSQARSLHAVRHVQLPYIRHILRFEDIQMFGAGRYCVRVGEILDAIRFEVVGRFKKRTLSPISNYRG